MGARDAYLRMAAVLSAAVLLEEAYPDRDRFSIDEVAAVMRDGLDLSEEATTPGDIVIGARHAYEAGWLLDVRELGYSDMSTWTHVGRPTWKGIQELLAATTPGRVMTE